MSREKGITRHALGCCFVHVVVPKPLHTFGRHALGGIRMRFTETALSGAWLIEPTPVWDDRGSFTRTFCEKELADCGLVHRFVQNGPSHLGLKGTSGGYSF